VNSCIWYHKCAAKNGDIIYKVNMTIGTKLTMMIALLFMTITVLPTVACGEGGDSETQGSAGRTMEVHAGDPVVVDRAFFVDDSGKTNVLVPSASNRQIVVLKTIIVNRTSTVIPLLIDSDAAKIGDRRGKRYGAIDPYENARVISGTLDDGLGTKKIPTLLWQITDLPRNHQVEGYLVFDVPKGLVLGTLFWDEVEYIPVDFVDYQRNSG
jgi:hypothetical protein